MTRWHLLGSGDSRHLAPPCSDIEIEATWNMQYDADLLDKIKTNRILPTLRLYQWNRPAMTVGRFQNIERTVRSEICQQQGIPIVRRITGGRGILHGTDLTISLATPLCSLLPDGYEAVGVKQVYNVLIEVFQRAFEACGISTQQGTEKLLPVGMGNCFAAQSITDIVSKQDNAKIMGAALHRSGDFVLMQASVPHAGNEELLACVFQGKCVSSVLPSDFNLAQFEQALVAEFAQNFEISFHSS